MRRSGLIIIADDDPNDISLISLAFQNAGINNPLKCLKDGEAVIRYLVEAAADKISGAQEMPLLLLLDWNMPRSNAVSVLQWIRQQPEYLNLLVAVLTGSDDPVQKKLAYEAGANWHIAKSVSFANLTQLIQNVRDFWDRSTSCTAAV